MRGALSTRRRNVARTPGAADRPLLRRRWRDPLPQVLFQELDRRRPRLLRRPLVRSVAVGLLAQEPVTRAVVDVRGVTLARFVEDLPGLLDGRVDAGVVLAVEAEHRRLDFLQPFDVRLLSALALARRGAVVDDGGVELGPVCGVTKTRRAAPAVANRRGLAVGRRELFPVR